jgi:thioredoxin-like negative regulator of GroEL
VRPVRRHGPGARRLWQRAYAGRLKVAKLNVDQNPVTASRYSVMSLPTLLFFRDGKVVDTAAGALPRQEIERYLTRFLAR